ncbi:kelch repeat-containing protein [Bdellovibrio sp. ZAP7]|uniref:kelch repeat-containing protein n=1 Tax=Bdellovibrio sp. ZAP7 TaxID=2231053 RepID=UPI001AEF5C38|nr:kelch repeat-containing protein [Bdellovibrio sp. ZAP7]
MGCTIDANLYDGLITLPSVDTPAPGVYSSKASRSLYPSNRRVRNTATTLQDGRILVIGGVSLDSSIAALKSVEIFDPTTSRWTDAAPLAQARARHTATLLGNGKILVVGGSDQSTYYATAELFDPSTNTWSSAGTMTVMRSDHSATLLQDGRVLIAGGATSAGSFTASMEIYDPATSSWSSAGTNLPEPRMNHAAVLLNSGKVFFVGGQNPPVVLTTTAIYDPMGAPTWGAAPTLTTGRAYLTASLLKDGRVVVIGGIASTGNPSPLVNIFDPSSPGSFSSGTSLSTARYGHTATAVDNQVIVTGGFSNNSASAALDDSLIYNAGSNTWSSLGTLRNGPRTLHTANPSGDYLYLLNGRDGNSSPVNMFEKIDISKFSWKLEGSMATDRAIHVTLALPNGKVLVAGGLSNPSNTAFTYLDSSEIFDPATGLWSAGPTLPMKRMWSTATRLNDGRFLIVGGVDETMTRITSTLFYTPSSNSWTAGPPIAMGRIGHSASLLPDGRVIIMGGNENTGIFPPSNKTEIFDPTTNQWTAGPNMLTAVSEHTAVTLNDNTILLVGGLTTTTLNSASAVVQLYNPTTNSFTAKASQSVGRYQASVALLPSGKVLSRGGIDSSQTILASSEIYDPNTDAWTAGPNLNIGRRAHNSISLPSGKILITGGATSNVSPLAPAASNEIYDPVANTFTADKVSFTNVHSLGTLVKLPDGKILMAGGVDPNYTVATTETYTEGQLNVSWISNTYLLQGRGANTSTVLKSGKVLFTGGQRLAEAAVLTETSVIFDPDTNTMIAGPNMTESRAYHTATLLPSGKVFIAGGINMTTGESSTGEIYDPTTNAFTLITLPRARYLHSAFVLPNGRLLLTGGVNSLGNPLENDVYDPTTGTWSRLADRPSPDAIEVVYPLNDSEFLLLGAFGTKKYNSTTDTWTSLATSPISRTFPTVSRLKSGLIFVAGGTDGGTGNPSDAVEIYNPDTDTWTSVASLDVPLVAMTSQALPDGKVAIIGGNQSISQSLAESAVRIYDPSNNQWSFGTPLSEARFSHSSVEMLDGQIVIFGGANLTFGMLPFWETLNY